MLFIPRKADCNEGLVQGYVWKPRLPNNAVLRELASSAPDASEDAFCSGHVPMPDGSILIVGGLDIVARCDPPCPPQDPPLPPVPDKVNYGHELIRQLDTSVDPPVWIEPIAPSLPLSMGRERWYPSAISLHNGDVFIAGHGPLAEPDGPLGCGPTYGEKFITETSDTLAWNPMGLANGVTTISRRYISPLCDGEDPRYAVGGYPRLHLLTTGFIVRTEPVRTGFVDIQFPACFTETRWQVSASAMPAVDHHGGNSVHIVYPDPLVGGFNPVDSVYAIGGTDGEDIEAFQPTVSIPVHATVEKLVKPDLNSQWVGGLPTQSPPDLNQQRFNHNSVLLLDGSILVNGGGAYDGNEMNMPFYPEKYRPPELFGISENAPGDVWKVMQAAEPSHRRYHSVAGLLKDGRVFSAGGDFPTSSYHTVNVYSPPYMFYARPEITASPATVDMGTAFDINVTLSDPDNTVLRVALVRTGSITHAWDMNQRYVVLNSVTTGTPPNLTLTVTAPASGFTAPPGYYMLTVVETTEFPGGEGKWIPSPGEWLRLDIP